MGKAAIVNIIDNKAVEKRRRNESEMIGQERQSTSMTMKDGPEVKREKLGEDAWARRLGFLDWANIDFRLLAARVRGRRKEGGRCSDVWKLHGTRQQRGSIARSFLMVAREKVSSIV